MKYQRHSVHNTKGKEDVIMNIRRYDIVQADLGKSVGSEVDGLSKRKYRIRIVEEEEET